MRVHLRGDTRKEPVSLTVENQDGARASAVIPVELASLRFTDITFAKDGGEVSLFAGTGNRSGKSSSMAVTKPAIAT